MCPIGPFSACLFQRDIFVILGHGNLKTAQPMARNRTLVLVCCSWLTVNIMLKDTLRVLQMVYEELPELVIEKWSLFPSPMTDKFSVPTFLCAVKSELEKA